MNQLPAIAVVGMACRFPGAETPSAMASLLRQGACGVAPLPHMRRGLQSIQVAAAGLLDDIDHFDRHPFRISANEAPLIDPQQRLVLETAWHALEDAGLSPACLRDEPIGVFIGAASCDHALLLSRARESIRTNPYLLNGAQNGAISGRLSYCLGLTGPSFTIDTACSSALAAVTLAGDALRLGHCDLALAGGVNALLSVEGFVALDLSGVLSHNGETRSFDAAAAGFVRSEGCGIVALKRLPDAIVQGDRIHAVLPGWATGQDGRSNGLSAPSRPAQVRVITQALRAAGITPADIGFIEAHGSATPLGDAIEAAALAEVFAGRPGPPGALGAVKANLGHLEAAAGIAGLIKAVLAVRDGVLPLQPCFEVPSARVPWADLPLTIPRETHNWASPRRMAGVSAFGMSGLNAHVIVSACDPSTPTSMPQPGPKLFLISAATPSALAARIMQLVRALEAPGVHLGQLAAAVSRRWAGLTLRAGFIASSLEEAKAKAGRLLSAPPRTGEPLVGPLTLSLPGGLSADDVILLRRVCPDLVDPGDTAASLARVVQVDAGLGLTGALLALHLAGAALRPQRMIEADPTTPELPGYPFERLRFCYEDGPGGAGPGTTARGGTPAAR